MKQRKRNTTAFWILLAEGVGLLSGLLTRNQTRLYGDTFIQPPLSPPAIVFPVVWTILYALMGIGAARVYRSEPSAPRRRGLLLFLLQLFFNFFWSILFFNLQNFALAFLWLLALWALIIGMILSFREADETAAYLQLPYLLWVTFAAYLNLGVWLLNG